MTTAAGVRLCPLRDEHLPILYQWRNEADFMALCSTRRNRTSYEHFRVEIQRDLQTDRPHQCLIELRDEYIGTIYCYNLNLTDGYAFITLYLASPFRGHGYGAIASALFLSALFKEHRLFKVYAEVYSYNAASLRALLNGGFIAEGRFGQHRVYNGSRYDLIRLAYYKSQLPRLHQFLKQLQSRVVRDQERANLLRREVHKNGARRVLPHKR